MKQQQQRCWRPMRSTTKRAFGVCHRDGSFAAASSAPATTRRRPTTPPTAASAVFVAALSLLMLMMATRTAVLPVAEAFEMLSTHCCNHRLCCPQRPPFFLSTTREVSRYRRRPCTSSAMMELPPPKFRTHAIGAVRKENAEGGDASTVDIESAPELTTTIVDAEPVVLTDEERRQIQALLNHDDGGIVNEDADLQKKVKDALPTLSPSLLMKLQRYLLDDSASIDMADDIQRVARAVQSAVEQRRSQGADLLQQLLGAGEIRKLDSLIGKAGRSGQLDPAFFQVLQLNLRDAAAAAQQPQQQRDPNDAATDSDVAAASRYQILSHIYTRCQEEVEKSLPPGIALLNKLLRTPEPSIRSNLISHYLTPPPQTITSPDGKTITLTNVNSRPLVSIDELISAVTTLVSQVRMVEAQQSQAGGESSSASSVAIMVESVRQLCKEVLGILMDSYGAQSSQVAQLKVGLQPVFRPDERNDDGSTPSAIPTATETTTAVPPS